MKIIKIILAILVYIMYLKANKETKTYSDKLVNLGWFFAINMIIAKFL